MRSQEMLDRTGRKDYKPKIDKVTKMLPKIERFGRAYGIRLILATQRPDANVIPGQIKNNMTYRALLILLLAVCLHASNRVCNHHG